VQELYFQTSRFDRHVRFEARGEITAGRDGRLSV
jgi:hypothetical protein